MIVIFFITLVDTERMTLNIILDFSIITELLATATNDTQRTFTRLQKASVRFWIPACLLPLLETQIPSNEAAFDKLLEHVSILSSLGGHWQKIPANCPKKIHALMSLDAALLPKRSVIWTDEEHFHSVHPDIEWGDHEILYGALAEGEAEDIAMLDLATQQLHIRNDLEQRIFQVLKHQDFVAGSEVGILERELATMVGAKHCICVANGTDAMLLALLAVGVNALDDVITTPFNFIATAQAIAFIGAKPIFVDINPETYQLDADLLANAVSQQTKAIIPANVYGHCADYDAINSIASMHGIPVIEDGLQSFGATYKGKYSGNLAKISCTSFFPHHTLGAYGDGGACFTNDDRLAERLRYLQIHGQEQRYRYVIMGLNSRLDTLQASVLLSKLTTLPQELQARRQIAKYYNSHLKDVLTLANFSHQDNTQGTYTYYAIEVENRDKLQDKLQKQGIQTAIHYPLPLHLQPVFGYLILEEGIFPFAERAARRVLSLPIHPYLREEEQQKIINIIKNHVN